MVTRWFVPPASDVQRPVQSMGPDRRTYAGVVPIESLARSKCPSCWDRMDPVSPGCGSMSLSLSIWTAGFWVKLQGRGGKERPSRRGPKRYRGNWPDSGTQRPGVDRVGPGTHGARPVPDAGVPACKEQACTAATSGDQGTCYDPLPRWTTYYCAL